MSDENNNKKSFLQLTWQQVISAVVVAVFLGALGWMGGVLRSSLDDLEDVKTRLTVTETEMATGIQEQVQQMSTQLGTTNANQRRIEILVTRLEVIVSKLEESTR